MAYRPAALPSGFTDLHTAWNANIPPGGQGRYNVMGVCVDYLDATKSGGTDYTMKFTLSDPRWLSGSGVQFRVFFKSEAEAPQIKNYGDIVLLREVVIKETPRYGKVALSTWTTTWTVLERGSVRDSTNEDGSDITVLVSPRNNARPQPPSPAEMKYVRALRDYEATIMHPAPPPTTSLQVNNIMRENGGTPAATMTKFCLIKDITYPTPNNGLLFVDLLGEVRRIYQNDYRTELSITDYTEHALLYDYSHSRNDNFDPGDPYGYSSTESKWPGPFGKQSLVVCCWDAQRSFANAHLKPGSFVHLKNIQISFDKNGTRLEGKSRGDQRYPDKVNLQAFRPSDAEHDERMKDLLRRKRDYEKYCDNSGIPFIRDPSSSKAKKATMTGHPQMDGTHEAPEPRDSKNKRNRKKKEKQRAKAAAAAAANNPETTTISNTNSTNTRHTRSNIPNPQIRTNATSAVSIPLHIILSPAPRTQTTLSGHKWTAPFVNARYKTLIRAIDFFPDDLTQLTRWVRRNQYAGLDDENSDMSDVDSDASALLGSDNNDESANERDGGDGDKKWEFRFALIVEEANPKAQKAEQRQTMQLIVSGSDAEYLLDEEACDLRRNTKALARVREKLFLLWGELGEVKERVLEEIKKTDEGDGGERMDVDGEEGATIEEKVAREMEKVRGEVKSEPFECFVDEYGVLRDGCAGEKMEDWERCFRIVKTRIA